MLEREGRIVGTAQLTVIPGLARRALKRGLIEAVRIASDSRGRGLGREFVQVTSDKRRRDAHRFYLSLGFAMSHEGFKLVLDEGH